MMKVEILDRLEGLIRCTLEDGRSIEFYDLPSLAENYSERDEDFVRGAIEERDGSWRGMLRHSGDTQV